MSKISLIIPSRNNFRYLQWAYNSYRKNISVDDEIIILDDASTDETNTWLQSLDDKNVIKYRNKSASANRLGLTILYNIGAGLASNDIICFGHADMYYAPGFKDNLLKYYTPQSVVCSTRVEPPLHPPGAEKLVVDFGLDIDSFKEEKFLKFAQLVVGSKHRNKTTQGIFAPWLISKDDYWEIGGHDELFAPQSREDSDIFNRFYLKGYKLIQSWDSLVYHLTCRGSRFKDGIGHNSKEWQETNYKGERNFIRKWGSFVQHNEYMLPIIANKYRIQVVIDCIDAIQKDNFGELLRIIEPWITQLVIFDKKRIYSDEVDNYISNEQKLTKYNMSERIIYNPENEKYTELDICVYATPLLLGINNCMFIQLLPRILDSINETGIYEYEHIRIKINRLKRDYYLENIVNINN